MHYRRCSVRPTWADVDLTAIRDNVAELKDMMSPSLFCAVVKADAYGHGAVPAARAAVQGGADWLAVALVEEGRELRDAGIEGPILVLSEPRPSEMVEVVEWVWFPLSIVVKEYQQLQQLLHQRIRS